MIRPCFHQLCTTLCLALAFVALRDAPAQSTYRIEILQRFGTEEPEAGTRPLSAHDRQLGGSMIGQVSGVAEGGDGAVYVVDAKMNKIVVFNRDGTLRHVFGSKGQGPGEFDFPRSIALSDAGELYVLDMRLSRMTVFDTAGTYRRTFPIAPVSFHVAVAGNKVYVDGAIRAGRPTVHVYSTTGQQLDELVVPLPSEIPFGQAGEAFSVGVMRDGSMILGSPDPGVWSPLAESATRRGRALHAPNPIQAPLWDKDVLIAQFSSRAIGQLANGNLLVLYMRWDALSYLDKSKAKTNMNLAILGLDGERRGVIRLPEETGVTLGVARNGTDFYLSTNDPFPQVMRVRLATGPGK